jgi:hypothetical protein
MYDYLTRGETLRCFLLSAWWALCFILCIGLAFFSFAYVITSPFDLTEAAQVARLLCFGISCVASYGAYYGVGDTLRHFAWVSFERSLRAKAGK